MLDFVLLPPVLAHQIQIDQAVAGTLHLEPNDQPQAGAVTPTWIALRRPGGMEIAAKDCNCQLQLFNAQTGTQTQLAIVPLSVAPGTVAAEITFPTVGQYELRLRGEPSATAETRFSPFQIRFPVTVAIAATPTPESSEPAPSSEAPPEVAPSASLSPRPWSRILISVGLGLGLLAALAAGVWLILKRDREAN
ncbi:hypothetical protein [Synechococcus elongatus]|uniref:hypothetical protein n=1 Tax=Synechococcus elongatus TaxID=32046 RepID=UPI000F7D68DB|nr:hypothetical protein [Synechococcus elongatus]